MIRLNITGNDRVLCASLRPCVGTADPDLEY